MTYLYFKYFTSTYLCQKKNTRYFTIFLVILFSVDLIAQQVDVDTCRYKLTDINGKDVKLSSFKGKVVYLDFWASWCKGCKVYFEWADSLKKKLSKKELDQVVFLYVSADNDSNAWKEGVTKWNIQGVHVISPLDHEGYLGKCFNVTGFPRFMLFDKKGKIRHYIAKTTYYYEVLDDLRALLEEK